MKIQRHRHPKAHQPVIKHALILACVLSIASILSQTWPKIQITASDGENNDQFGQSVAITNTHALVGAHSAEGGKGAAYLFFFTGTEWTQSTDIKKGTIESEKFGTSVSLSSQYAVVGAPDANESQGRAYLYTISGLTWTEVALTLQGATSGSDRFGVSVAVTDNFLLIGASQANSKQGAAYLYSRGSDDVWALQGTLTASDSQSSSYFGSSVALTDTHAVVGAYAANTDNISYGAIYVYSPESTTWEQKKKIVGYVDGQMFGSLLALSDDFMIVSTTVSSGSSYLFSRSGDDWVLKETVATSGPVAITNDYAIINEDLYALQNDDWNKIASLDVPAVSSASMSESFAFMGFADSESSKGEGLIFVKPTTPSLPQFKVQPPVISPSPQPIQADILTYQSTRSKNYGFAVAIMNDLLIASSPNCIDQSRCDGGRTAVLKKDTNGKYLINQRLEGQHRNIDAMFGYSLDVNSYWMAITSKGTMYQNAQTAMLNVFRKNTGANTYTRVAGLRPKDNNQNNMDFGHSMSVGQIDIIVGVPGYNVGSVVDVGAIMSYRYRAADNLWGRTPVVATASDAIAGDHYGHSVDFDEAFLAVGNSPSDNNRCAVYILTKSGFGFAQFYKISGNGKRGFGWSVLLLENELIVTSPQDDDNGASINGGSVSVFAKNSTNRFVEYDTIRHTPAAERRFGYAVARKGNRMAIGTNTCPNGAPCASQGKAYLYTKSGQQWVPLRSFSSGHVDGSDLFGTRVAIDEDDVVVGAPNGNSGSGRVYSYYA